MLIREESRVNAAAKTAATIGPTKGEIATLAYRLWQANGCAVGSDKEDWFRAEAMLINTLVVKGRDLSGCSSDICNDNRAEFDIGAEFRWAGHWVVWESEWGGARWVFDLAIPEVEVSIGI